MRQDEVEISLYGFVLCILESIDQGLLMAVDHRVYVSGSTKGYPGWWSCKEKSTKKVSISLNEKRTERYRFIRSNLCICMYVCTLDIKVGSRPCPPISLWTCLLDATKIFHVVDWYCKRSYLKWPLPSGRSGHHLCWSSFNLV